MSDVSTLNTVIKSPTLIAEAQTPPVIVVGLPRSGSSYLAHVLSCLDQWFVFDDLYPYQKAAELGISSRTNLAHDRGKLRDYVHSISWHLRAKLRFEKNFNVPNLNWDDTYDMEAALLIALNQDPLTWPVVLNEWMTRLAKYAGKQYWGYKTPQDFLHLDELANIFPSAKFVCILRDPRDMMRSYKNLPRVKTHGSQDGESGQYHPIAYSIYWNTAYKRVVDYSERGHAPIEIVKFEDLTTNPEATANRLAMFLNTSVSGNVRLTRRNSSLGKKSSKQLTQIEVAVCEKLAGSSMRDAGYQRETSRSRNIGITDFVETTLRFSFYQLMRIIKDKRARASVYALFKSLLTRR